MNSQATEPEVEEPEPNETPVIIRQDATTIVEPCTIVKCETNMGECETSLKRDDTIVVALVAIRNTSNSSVLFV